MSVGIVIAAVSLGLVVLYQTNYYPRTDDAQVFANFIGIAPQVDGPLIHLHVQDNQLVKKGDVLFEIDQRPYAYALELAFPEIANRPPRAGVNKGKHLLTNVGIGAF